MRAVSHDPTCRQLLTLTDGRAMTAVDLQEIYLEAARSCYELRAGDLAESAQIEAKDVFTRWQETLDALRRDPSELADQLDWVAKLQLMESYRDRDGLGWGSPKLALIDLQYCDVDPRRSLFAALVRKGRMRRLVTDDEIERARLQPPTDTRAYFRGRVMEKYGPSVVAASWDSVIFDVPGQAGTATAAAARPAARAPGRRWGDHRRQRRRDGAVREPGRVRGRCRSSRMPPASRRRGRHRDAASGPPAPRPDAADESETADPEAVAGGRSGASSGLQPISRPGDCRTPALG